MVFDPIVHRGRWALIGLYSQLQGSGSQLMWLCMLIGAWHILWLPSVKEQLGHLTDSDRLLYSQVWQRNTSALWKGVLRQSKAALFFSTPSIGMYGNANGAPVTVFRVALN